MQSVPQNNLKIRYTGQDVFLNRLLTLDHRVLKEKRVKLTMMIFIMFLSPAIYLRYLIVSKKEKNTKDSYLITREMIIDQFPNKFKNI